MNSLCSPVNLLRFIFRQTLATECAEYTEALTGENNKTPCLLCVLCVKKYNRHGRYERHEIMKKSSRP